MSVLSSGEEDVQSVLMHYCRQKRVILPTMKRFPLTRVLTQSYWKGPPVTKGRLSRAWSAHLPLFDLPHHIRYHKCVTQIQLSLSRMSFDFLHINVKPVAQILLLSTRIDGSGIFPSSRRHGGQIGVLDEACSRSIVETHLPFILITASHLNRYSTLDLDSYEHCLHTQ